MAKFSYIAVDQSETIKRGLIESANCDQVGKILNARGLKLVSCKKASPQNLSLHTNIGELFQTFFNSSISPLEKISFAHHLSVMLKSGVPIVEAVQVLKSQSSSYKFKKMIDELAVQLEKGQNLSEFLKNRNFFSSAHLAILKSGEKSGKITTSLQRIGDDLKRDYQLKKKVKGAMAYPLVITLTLVAVSGFVIVFVLPKVGEVFRQMRLKIPLPTKILLFLGDFLKKSLLEVILGFFIFFLVVFIFFQRSNFLKPFLIQIVCRLPIANKIIYQLSLARFTRSLASLLAGGVAISEALDISSNVFIDKRYRQVIKKVGERVQKGVSLSEAFKEHRKQFQGMFVKMCSVGEKSGNLAPILEDLADFYEEEVEEKLENFSTIIEPVLMLLVGLGVGGMILSIVGPIYKMMGELNP